MKIKSIQDAEYFINNFEKFANRDGDTDHIFTFKDSSLDLEGITNIYKRGENFYTFSLGKNWRDQIEEPRSIETMIKIVYKKRKDINNAMKQYI